MTVDLNKLITAHKAAATSNGAKKAIDALHGELEKLLEDHGLRRQFDEAATQYLKQKTAEIVSIRWARNSMLWLGSLLSLAVVVAFYFVLLCPQSSAHLATLPDAARTAFITASFVSSFGLIAIIMRGILRANEATESPSPVPEGVKILIEIMPPY